MKPAYVKIADRTDYVARENGSNALAVKTLHLIIIENNKILLGQVRLSKG